MDTVYDGNAKINTVNKHVFVWVCNFLVGGFGVDRFIRGTNRFRFVQALHRLMDYFRHLALCRFCDRAC
ncbi:TM2 domain [Fructobacillus cardui]|nr:TM2 domain [Fructobacillus cardui]